MSTDFENELRDLFREKAGEAPLATPSLPASAPRQVLRRGRLYQVGTVLGSAAIVVALIVGSVAGLTRILGDGGDDDVANGGYEIFERTATIEAFTVTSPSDWYLVDQWPLSMLIPVEASGGSTSKCVSVPGGEPVECESSAGEPTASPIPVPHGLPMLQLSNVDLGPDHVACRDGLPADAAVLSIAVDHDVMSGTLLPVFPSERGLPSLSADGPCGPGSYSRFTVNGYPMFVWVGVGSEVSEEDRATVRTSYERMSAIDSWIPEPPNHPTPAYVIAGGTSDNGDPWRLDLRRGERGPELSLEGVDPSFVGVEPKLSHDPLDPTLEIEICCGWTDGTGETVLVDVTFGFVHRDATGVELQVVENDELTGRVLPGTIIPVPPSLGTFGSDLFFIPGTAGLAGSVVPVGIVGTEESPSIAESRGEVLSLSAGFRGHTWIVRFTGSFADGNACIRVTIDSETEEPLCHSPGANPLVADDPSADTWSTVDLVLLVTAVRPSIEQLRFQNDDGTVLPSGYQCAMGPSGWTEPDRRVCVLPLPPEGSGVLQFLDGEGRVVFEHGMGWGSAEGEEPTPAPVDPVHGGTYWAVYPWVGDPGSREADDVSARLLQEFGIESFPGDLTCDDGAAEALGTNAPQGIGVYFATQDEANAFASEFGLLGHEADPVIARVTTYCLD